MAEERVESEGFYEMLWDCAHCGTKGLLGKRQRRCPECGAPQDADKRYFPTEDQKQLATGHVYEGADAHCPSCSAPMGAKVKNCTQCGSPMDGSKQVVGREAIGAGGPATPNPKPKARGPRPAWLIPVIVIAVLAVIGFLVWFLFIRTKIGQTTVDRHRWEATIQIDQYGDQHHSAWRNEVPVMASNIVCHQEERGSHQVPDGEECHTEKHDKKDGTYEQVKKCSPKTRSVPDYDDKCSFTVRDWAKVDELRTSGTGTAIVFPTPNVSATAPAVMGERRAGARSEKLTLDFVGGDSCDWSTSPGGGKETAWRNLSDGTRLEVKLRATSGNVVCDSVIP